MLNCGETNELLARRADQALDPRDVALLKAHLSCCAACANIESAHDELARFFASCARRTGQLAAPPDLWARISTQAAPETHAAGGVATPARRVPLLPAACFLTAAALVLFMLGLAFPAPTSPRPIDAITARFVSERLNLASGSTAHEERDALFPEVEDRIILASFNSGSK